MKIKTCENKKKSVIWSLHSLDTFTGHLWSVWVPSLRYPIAAVACFGGYETALWKNGSARGFMYFFIVVHSVPRWIVWWIIIRSLVKRCLIDSPRCDITDCVLREWSFQLTTCCVFTETTGLAHLLAVLSNWSTRCCNSIICQKQIWLQGAEPHTDPDHTYRGGQKELYSCLYGKKYNN